MEIQDVYITNWNDFPDKIYTVTEHRDIMTTAFSDYSVTEGLLFIIALLLAVSIVCSFIGRR